VFGFAILKLRRIEYMSYFTVLTQLLEFHIVEWNTV